MTAVLEEEEAPATAPTSPIAGGYEFDGAFQSKITALALRDIVFAQRTDGLIRPEYLELDADRFIVDTALDFYQKYRRVPDLSTLPTVLKDARAAKKIREDLWNDVTKRIREIIRIDLSDREFVTDKVAEFAKNRAVEEALISSVSALEKGNFGKIEELMRKALDVGANDDGSAYDYFKEIEARTNHRIALACGTIKPDGITTGYAEIDKHMHHGGWGRRELSALMARAKWGKSMGIGDFAKNAALAGYNVFIGSCEVSAQIYGDRLDANFAETAMKALKDNAKSVEAKIKAIAPKCGNLIIHDFASGTLKPSQLRRLLQRYRARGIIFDLICIDYADIMAPERMINNPIAESKSIWIDLRAIAYEENAAVLTATQTNRDGAKKMTAEATDVAEDYNKVRTADLLISGNSTKEEMDAGEARLHFAASRNQKEVTFRIQQDREMMKFLKKVLEVTT